MKRQFSLSDAPTPVSCSTPYKKPSVPASPPIPPPTSTIPSSPKSPNHSNHSLSPLSAYEYHLSYSNTSKEPNSSSFFFSKSPPIPPPTSTIPSSPKSSNHSNHNLSPLSASEYYPSHSHNSKGSNSSPAFFSTSPPIPSPTSTYILSSPKSPDETNYSLSPLPTSKHYPSRKQRSYDTQPSVDDYRNTNECNDNAERLVVLPKMPFDFQIKDQSDLIESQRSLRYRSNAFRDSNSQLSISEYTT